MNIKITLLLVALMGVAACWESENMMNDNKRGGMLGRPGSLGQRGGEHDDAMQGGQRRGPPGMGGDNQGQQGQRRGPPRGGSDNQGQRRGGKHSGKGGKKGLWNWFFGGKKGGKDGKRGPPQGDDQRRGPPQGWNTEFNQDSNNVE